MYMKYNIYRIFCRFFNYFTMSGFSNTSSAVAANAFVAV